VPPADPNPGESIRQDPANARRAGTGDQEIDRGDRSCLVKKKRSDKEGKALRSCTLFCKVLRSNVKVLFLAALETISYSIRMCHLSTLIG